MSMPPAPFAVHAGFVSTDEYRITIDDRPVAIRANNALNGRLNTRATLTLARSLAAPSARHDDATLDSTIAGSLQQPHLDLPPAAATAMAALIDENMEELKARKAEQLLQKSQHQVEQLLSGFDRMKRRDDAR